MFFHSFDGICLGLVWNFLGSTREWKGHDLYEFGNFSNFDESLCWQKSIKIWMKVFYERNGFFQGIACRWSAERVFVVFDFSYFLVPFCSNLFEGVQFQFVYLLLWCHSCWFKVHTFKWCFSIENICQFFLFWWVQNLGLFQKTSKPACQFCNNVPIDIQQEHLFFHCLNLKQILKFQK